MKTRTKINNKKTLIFVSVYSSKQVWGSNHLWCSFSLGAGIPKVYLWWYQMITMLDAISSHPAYILWFYTDPDKIGNFNGIECLLHYVLFLRWITICHFNVREMQCSTCMCTRVTVWGYQCTTSAPRPMSATKDYKGQLTMHKYSLLNI